MTTKLLNDSTWDQTSPRQLFDLSAHECAAVSGGRIKEETPVSPGKLLMSADGDPVGVYVDGICINSPADGYVHL